MFLLSVYQSHLDGLLKHRLMIILTVSGSVGLGWSRKICIFNKFPCDALSVGPTLREPLICKLRQRLAEYGTSPVFVSLMS